MSPGQLVKMLQQAWHLFQTDSRQDTYVAVFLVSLVAVTLWWGMQRNHDSLKEAMLAT